MKQRLRKLISGFLCFALIASTVVGALGVSFNVSKAMTTTDSGDVEFSSIWQDVVTSVKTIRPDYSDSTLSDLYDYFTSVLENENYLVSVVHDPNTTSWAVSAYFFSSTIQSYSSSQYYSGIGYTSASGNKIALCAYLRCTGTTALGSIIANPSQRSNLARNTSNPYGDNNCYPNLFDINNSTRYVWLSQNVAEGSGREIWSGSKNLYLSLTPPIYDMYLKSFWLGEKRYLTIVDQSVMRLVDPDKMAYQWYIFNDGDMDYVDLQYRFITWNDIVLIPGGNNFISGLINVSPEGVYAYDITDLDWEYIAISRLWDTDLERSIYNAVNVPYVFESEDPAPGTNGTPSTQTQIYQYINNYIQNYPSVTVVPQQLAEQLAGDHAISSGLGYLRLPVELYKYSGINFEPDFDNAFHFDLNTGVFDPSYNSLLNFNLFNSVIIPSRERSQIELLNWDTTLLYQNGIIDCVSLGEYAYTNDLFEMYDLIIFADGDAAWFQDPRTTFISTGYQVGTVGYTGDLVRSELNNGYSIYWVLTDKAIKKSQLYVFCDSINKLYDVCSGYITKHDLWDNSFLDWSMSIYLQLETINGYLFRFEQEYKTWDLSNKLSSIVTKLQEISNNTSETDVDPWYLALFNWIKSFEPSNLDFIGWVEEYDDFVDELPDPGGATIIPFPTAAPTALPTVAVAGG